MIPNKKLLVFVSSTYKDLKTERQAAVEAILKAGHIPAGMELFSAGSESQMETIRRWIDDSDIYMLILGGRYGSVEKSTSLSYTELEYDYANQQGKPAFSVVITDEAIDKKVKSDGKDAIETEYPKELKFFREKVLSKTSSFFTDHRDIKLAVHETLADYQRRMKFTGWVSGKDVTDPTPLLDEIAHLREEREKLLKQLATVASPSKTIRQPQWNDEELRQVALILQGIELTTDVFSSGKKETYDLLNILTGLSDTLITGVTNQINAQRHENFLYFNACPKLELHELAAIEKVAGVRWTRYRLTNKGKALVAYMERLKSKPDKKAANEEKSDESHSSESESKPAPATKKPVRKRKAAD